MKTVIDVENTVQKREGKLHLDPFEEKNELVMVGALTETGDEYLIRMSDESICFIYLQETKVKYL